MNKPKDIENVIDKETFINLINENRIKLYKTAISILKNDDDACDAIQETLMSAYKNIDSINSPQFFTTWITRILINKCYDILKKNKKIVYIDAENIEETDSYYDNYKVESSLEHILNKLEEELKTITVLYYYDEISVSEISKMLKIPEGTVKSRLSRARKKILELIKEEEGEV